jgi:hypothetical protein
MENTSQAVVPLLFLPSGEKNFHFTKDSDRLMTLFTLGLLGFLFQLTQGQTVTTNTLASSTVTFTVDSKVSTLTVSYSVADTTSYLCVGYSPNLQMSGTTAICGCDGATSGVHQYSLQGRSTGSQQTISASITGASCTINNTHTTLSFSQPYTTTATSGLLIADSSGNIPIALAYGSSNTFQQHTQRTTFTQNVLNITPAPTTAAPTNAPTTASPTTPAPTSSTTPAPTASTTPAPTAEFAPVTTYFTLAASTLAVAVDAQRTTVSVSYSISSTTSYVCVGYSPNLGHEWNHCYLWM